MSRKIKCWRVDIIESERGWGQRVDETREFPTFEEADAFREKYNSKNNKPTVPDWYMYATDPQPVFEKKG